jgi:Zn-dependent protease
MISLLFTDPLAFFIVFPGLLASITWHEFAHAWVADKLGDPTPRYQGRVTLDPRAHLDPLGTLAMLMTRFGWGRPVEFDPYNLKNPLRDTALIAIAGPISNIIVAVILSILLHTVSIPFLSLAVGLAQILVINLVLALFNLIPIHPLDGGKVLVALLPRELALEFDDFMHRYGMIVLIMLIVPWNGTSAVSSLLSPALTLLTQILL